MALTSFLWPHGRGCSPGRGWKRGSLSRQRTDALGQGIGHAAMQASTDSHNGSQLAQMRTSEAGLGDVEGQLGAEGRSHGELDGGIFLDLPLPNRSSMGSSVVPMKATLLCSIKPRTVSLGSCCSLSLHRFHTFSAVSPFSKLFQITEGCSSRLVQWYIGLPMAKRRASANFWKRSRSGLSPV